MNKNWHRDFLWGVDSPKLKVNFWTFFKLNNSSQTPPKEIVTYKFITEGVVG